MRLGKTCERNVRLTLVVSTYSQKKNTLSCSTTSLLRAWRWIWINQIKQPQTPMLLSWMSIDDDSSSITDTILSKSNSVYTFIYIFPTLWSFCPPLYGGAARAVTNHTRTALYIFLFPNWKSFLFRFSLFWIFLTAIPRSLPALRFAIKSSYAKFLFTILYWTKVGGKKTRVLGKKNKRGWLIGRKLW
jgi:hypothetical protein